MPVFDVPFNSLAVLLAANESTVSCSPSGGLSAPSREYSDSFVALKGVAATAAAVDALFRVSVSCTREAASSTFKLGPLTVARDEVRKEFGAASETRVSSIGALVTASPALPRLTAIVSLRSLSPEDVVAGVCFDADDEDSPRLEVLPAEDFDRSRDDFRDAMNFPYSGVQ